MSETDGLIAVPVPACARLLALAALCTPALALADDPLFPRDGAAAPPLRAELHLPLTDLLRIKPDQEGEFAATLTLQEHAPTFTLTVSPRGKSRREHCDFPPLWLDFDKGDLDGTILAGQNKLKLVTHCSSRLAKREFLATEMLIYRMLGLFTDNAFRVRALALTYVDTERDRAEQHHGFVIEHKRRLAQRLQGELVETPGLSLAQLDADFSAFIGLFQYMIGNTDFSLRRGPSGDCCHNAVPVRVGARVLAVPYDFDATGLVNPPYSAPAPNLSIRKVTQRLYRGYCEHNHALPGLAQRFLDNRARVEQLINDFNDVPGLRRDKVKAYLQRFYDTLESPRAMQSRLIKRCR